MADGRPGSRRGDRLRGGWRADGTHVTVHFPRGVRRWVLRHAVSLSPLLTWPVGASRNIGRPRRVELHLGFATSIVHLWRPDRPVDLRPGLHRLNDAISLCTEMPLDDVAPYSILVRLILVLPSPGQHGMF